MLITYFSLKLSKIYHKLSICEKIFSNMFVVLQYKYKYKYYINNYRVFIDTFLSMYILCTRVKVITMVRTRSTCNGKYLLL